MPDSDGSDDICVGSGQGWENVLSVLFHAGLLRTKAIDGGKFKLTPNEAKWKEMKLYLEDEHNLVMHESTYRPRGKSKCGLIQKYICIQVKKKVKKTAKDAKNVPRFTGPGAQKAYQSLHPFQPLFAKRGSNRATQLSKLLAEHRKDVQAAQCENTYVDLVRGATKFGFMGKDLLDTLKENGSTSTSEASASASLPDSKTNANASTSTDATDAPDAPRTTADMVKVALNLDFDVRMADNDQLRPPRYGSNVKEPFPIIKEKQATERMRFCAVALADFWGYSDPTRPFEERQTIARAACSQIAYDHGYRKSTGGSQLYRWREQLYARLVEGGANPIGRKAVRGRTAYTDKIEKDEPGYLRQLYRYATRMKGAMSNFQELADCMNAKSAAPDESRMTISIHRLQLYRWWKKEGGTEKSSIEKPRLTAEHRQQRLEWIDKWATIMTDESKPVVYLDEKWFYTTSRRRKLKLLPLSEEEDKDPNLAMIMASENSPKIRSRRYPCKVMYLGVVARPNADKGFNGRIMIKRVAREEEVKKRSRNQNFSPDVKVNEAIKSGTDWHDLYVEDITAGDLCDAIAEFYGLSEFVTDRLELLFPNYNEDGQRKKNQGKNYVIKRDEVLSSLERYTPTSNGQKVKVELSDVEIGVRYQKNDKITKDVSCDSKWMLETMDGVGKAIREAYHWVKWNPRNVQQSNTIYLVMDNAGGHGTDEAVQQYSKDLKNNYKIEIVHQVPRSPETNVLDLGIWMSLQSAVEKEHRGQKCDANALDGTVMRVWENVASEDAFRNVFGKLPVIYHNIKTSGGGNNTVETNRGKAGAANIAEQTKEGGELLWPIGSFEDDDIEDDIGDGDDDNEVINLL